MSCRETPEELEVRSFLEHLGYQVDKIPEGSRKTADYRATWSTERCLVEVKERNPPPEEMERLRAGLEVVKSDPLARVNVVSGILRDADKQLYSSAAVEPAVPKPFRVVAFYAEGPDADVWREQIRDTFLGTIDLVTSTQGGTARTKPCYYFDFNEAFTLRDLNGVMIIVTSASASTGEAELCVNEFATTYPDFKKSHLYLAFAQQGGLRDPIEEEKSGRGFRADGPLDRKNSKQVLEHVRAKYGDPYLLDVRPEMHSVSVAVDRLQLTDSVQAEIVKGERGRMKGPWPSG